LSLCSTALSVTMAKTGPTEIDACLPPGTLGLLTQMAGGPLAYLIHDGRVCQSCDATASNVVHVVDACTRFEAARSHTDLFSFL